MMNKMSFSSGSTVVREVCRCMRRSRDTRRLKITCGCGKAASQISLQSKLHNLCGRPTYQCPALMCAERKRKENNRENKNKALEEKREKKQVK